MAHFDRQPAFAAFVALISMTLLAGALYGLCVWLVPDFFADPGRAVSAVAPMAAVVWLSCLLSLGPVIVLGSRGVGPTVWAYFVGAAVRVVICLMAAVVLVKRLAYPLEPVMITLVMLYLPMLFVEAGFVGRYLWLKDHLRGAKPRGQGVAAEACP